MSNLWRRQDINVIIVDDQSPILDNAYAGADWFNLDATDAKGYNNNTLSATYTAGATMELSFEGVWPIYTGLHSQIDFFTGRHPGNSLGRSTSRKQDISFSYIFH